MSTTFTSKINGNDIYAKRAERTRSGVNLETFTPSGGTEQKGILPVGLVPGQEGTNEANILATQQYVLDQMGSVAEALVFKGTIGAAVDHPSVNALPDTHKIGWTYKVATAGTYAGKTCEVGDMIICVKDGTAAADADWTVVQNNLDGAVTGPVSATDGSIAVFNNTTGKVIKDGNILATDIALKTEMSVVAGTGTDADKTTITLKADTSATVLTAHQDISGKADKVSGAASGNLAGLDENGNLTNSGIAASTVKIKQTAKTDPTASGDTLSFIDSITQDENGEITATKKSVTVASTYDPVGTNPVNGTAVAAALAALDAEVTSSDGSNVRVKVTEIDGKVTAVNITDNTAAATHVHGNITNDGKIGTDANRAIVTGTGGAVEATNLTTDDPTASGTSTSGLAYIDSVSQGSNGKLSATKAYVPVAGSSSYGVVTVETAELPSTVGIFMNSSAQSHIASVSPMSGSVPVGTTTFEANVTWEGTPNPAGVRLITNNCQAQFIGNTILKISNITGDCTVGLNMSID